MDVRSEELNEREGKWIESEILRTPNEYRAMIAQIYFIQNIKDAKLLAGKRRIG